MNIYLRKPSKKTKNKQKRAVSALFRFRTLCKKDNRLGARLQGDYLYDKGENDELCYVSQLRSTDLQVYYNIFDKKSKINNGNIF